MVSHALLQRNEIYSGKFIYSQKWKRSRVDWLFTSKMQSGWTGRCKNEVKFNFSITFKPRDEENEFIDIWNSRQRSSIRKYFIKYLVQTQKSTYCIYCIERIYCESILFKNIVVKIRAKVSSHQPQIEIKHSFNIYFS